MNWTCNCSLYNTLVLVVYIILLSERGSERWSRGVRRDYLAFLAHVGRGAFGNANTGRGAFGGTLVAGCSTTCEQGEGEEGVVFTGGGRAALRSDHLPRRLHLELRRAASRQDSILGN